MLACLESGTADTQGLTDRDGRLQ